MIITGVPAEECDEVHDSLGEVTALAVARGHLTRLGIDPAQGEDREAKAIAVTLAELTVALGLEEECQVSKAGHRVTPAEGFVEKHVQRCAGQPLFATDDVGDAHQMVVDDVRQMVGRQVVSTLVEHLVIEDGAIEGHATTDHIVDLYLYVGRDEEANDILRTACDESVDLLTWQDERIAHRGAGRSVVLEVRYRFTLLLQFLGRVEGDISLTRIEELLDVLAVDITALALTIGAAVPTIAHAFVEADTEPLEGLDDISLRPRDEALAICILDTQQELTAVSLREEIVIESCADTADMQRSRRTGSKANAY